MRDRPPPDGPVTIVGEGALRAGIERRLGAHRPAGDRPVLLAASDGWDTGLLDRAAADAADAGVAFLGVYVELGRAVIGPMVRPGLPGCRRCVVTRRAAAAPDAAAGLARLEERHRDRLAAASGWLTAFAVEAVAAIVAAEVAALRAGGKPRTWCGVIVVELDRLHTTTHSFLPDPRCPRCADPPDDGPVAVHLLARPKPTPGTSRLTRIADRDADLRRSYVDSFVGVVSEVRDVDAAGLPVAYARTGLPGFDRPELGTGRATDRTTGRLAAILEAVERRAGAVPSGRRTRCRAPYTEVADSAVDPRTLGLPSPPASAPFDPEREMDWVWGYSLGRGRPVLVPLDYAYFAAGGADRPWAYETSNGCALGSCYEEAALHGLLEVTERDAFLLTWYARLPAPLVALWSARTAEIRLLAERIERVHGYQVRCHDTTVEHGIPSVLLLAVDPAPAPGRPAVMCAAAAHLDPERACWAALGELALVVERQVRAYPPEHERAAAMAADPDLVRVMDDHVTLYGHHATRPRWDFLPGAGDGALTFAEAFRGRPEPTDELRDDLVLLVDRYTAAGLEVIVVDQTGPEQRAGGLSAVKVIVPGALPMTFGHRNRRVTGLPRLDGLLERRAAELNPYPHPFS